MSSTADFHLALTDVNDNPPRLAKDYTGLFFCHPLSTPESLIFEVTDDDQQSLWRSQFTFALGRESLQNDWEVSKINGEFSNVQGEKSMMDEGIMVPPPPPLAGFITQHRIFFLLQESSSCSGNTQEKSSKPQALWEGKFDTPHPGWCTWIDGQFEHQL